MRYENEMADASFWNLQERARDIVQQVKLLKGWVGAVGFNLSSACRRVRANSTSCSSMEPDAGDERELDSEVERDRPSSMISSCKHCCAAAG
jgi:peptide chain release factor 2